MINPIVYFASNGENIITGKIKEFQDNVQKETAYTSNKTSDNKILESNFKEKFEDNLCILLENKFKNCDFTCLLSGDITNVEKIEVFVNKKEDSKVKLSSEDLEKLELQEVLMDCLNDPNRITTKDLMNWCTQEAQSRKDEVYPKSKLNPFDPNRYI